MTQAAPPPAILFATPQQACRAVAIARALGTAIMLVTAGGACARLGPGYLLAAVRRAGGPPALIDCGGDAGWAMLALRLGWRDLHLAAPPATVRRLAEMAAACGAHLHRRLPPAFDLPAHPAGLEAWLRERRHDQNPAARGLSPPPPRL